MTEESSADDERDADERPGEQRADEERSGDAEEGTDEEGSDEELAPAQSDETPDVEAAKAELEAVGAADDEEETVEQEEKGDQTGKGDQENEEQENAEAPAIDPDEPAGTDEGSGADEDADPNPEDLVRDPDEPQVTSSLDEEETDAADAEPDDAEPESTAETDTPDPAAVADADATEPSDDPDAESDGRADDKSDDGADAEPDEDPDAEPDHQPGVPDDVQKYDRFKKVDGSQYDRVNEFLRDRTYITAREWAIARLCSDFRTETGVEMTKIGENLPELVPFMTDTYTPQAVNQARSSFEDKVRTAGATFLYGAMCDFFTAEELDDVMYESTEVAKFLLEVEGVELSVDDELEAEDRISAVMRDVRSSSAELRHERCPDCGAELSGGEK